MNGVNMKENIVEIKYKYLNNNIIELVY